MKRKGKWKLRARGEEEEEEEEEEEGRGGGGGWRVPEGARRAPEFDGVVEVLRIAEGDYKVVMSDEDDYVVYNYRGEAYVKSLSDAKPSEVTEVYWLYACRKKGKYPEATKRSGKWLIFVPPEKVDELWERVRRAVEEGRLGDVAKVSTAKPRPSATDRSRVICVYTYDWTDRDDVMRIREELRKLGVTWKIPYKADQDTREGRYAKAGFKRISKYYE
ncbi:MAG: DUF1917 domain-containing protein [Candidatus Jordarchaeales archaeon]